MIVDSISQVVYIMIYLPSTITVLRSSVGSWFDGSMFFFGAEVPGRAGHLPPDQLHQGGATGIHHGFQGCLRQGEDTAAGICGGPRHEQKPSKNATIIP